jgi:hypothetical protein
MELFFEVANDDAEYSTLAAFRVRQAGSFRRTMAARRTRGMGMIDSLKGLNKTG